MYIVYKTTNLINNMIYIGVHKTNNIDDGYIGSGKFFKLAVKKYGKNYFKKEILFIYDNIEDAYKKEKELVNEDFIMSDKTYNLVCGGSISISFKRKNVLRGDKHPMWGKKTTIDSNLKRSNTLKITNQKQDVKKRRKEGGKKAAITKKLNGFFSPMKGRQLTDEDKKKKSISALNRQKIMCPHCLKTMDPGNAKRFHFDKCKLRF
jgi:hypothetical protein